MSLYGALFSGVSGLTAQSNKIAVLSDNISNVNTVGYKQTQGLFESLVTSSSGAFSPGGVLGTTRALVSKQGLLTSTSSPTDIAISGSGFFVVNQTPDGTGQVLYTRAGAFTQDETGNFRNAAGFFLQAWPLDREGRLPGEAGNLNTNSAANISSLTTVNVQNLTGSAAATTAISLGANLKSSQVSFAGAAGVAEMDAQDTTNFGIAADSLIIPTTVDSIVRGDIFNISTGAGLSYNYTYGGFTFGRVVTSGAAGDSGASLASLGDDTNALYNTTTAVPIGDIDTTSGTTNIVVTVGATPAGNYRVGDSITITGLTTDVGGVPFAEINGTHIITAVGATTVTFASTTLATGTAGSTELASSVANPIITTASSNDVVISLASHGLSVGDVVTIEGITGAVGGIPAAELNQSFVVSGVSDTNHFTITTPTTQGNGSDGGSGTINVITRPFAGNILDATTVTEPFLGTTGTSGFTSAGLTFTISTADTGTTTFTYTTSAPNAQVGQFNNLTNLATAINAVSGLTARIVGGQIYIGAINADDAVVFANGSSIGIDGPPVQAGIDWVGELGLANVAAGSNRFSTLEGLADQVNADSGLSASVDNPLSASTLNMYVDDPLDTVTFTDDAGNTGSLLAALGLVDSLNGGAFVAGDTGALGPSYDPADSTKNMASGEITPHFTRPMQIFDALGTGHDINISFLKTGSNTWAVEAYAVPETDITSSLPDGLLAFGSVAFNGDGTLLSVDTGLSQDIDIVWTTGALASTVAFNWGTAGQPFGTPNATIGRADGLSQFDSPYRVSFVNQNGAPVGDLTGVSIDENGFIVASYSNGETQSLFKIPLASFANPDQLSAQSGNVFLQTSASGEVNLSEAGGSGVGKIASSSLEASNVELAEQLTDMIVAQRAYQANTKVISTADQLLDDLNRILQ